MTKGYFSRPLLKNHPVHTMHNYKSLWNNTSFSSRASEFLLFCIFLSVTWPQLYSYNTVLWISNNLCSHFHLAVWLSGVSGEQAILLKAVPQLYTANGGGMIKHCLSVSIFPVYPLFWTLNPSTRHQVLLSAPPSLHPISITLSPTKQGWKKHEQCQIYWEMLTIFKVMKKKTMRGSGQQKDHSDDENAQSLQATL